LSLLIYILGDAFELIYTYIYIQVAPLSVASPSAVIPARKVPNCIDSWLGEG
jgi:hypothetical protein